MRYRIVGELSCEDAAYIAGLVDGEGTVTLSRRHANEQRHLVVSIANTDRALLEFVLTTVGAGKVTAKRTTSQRHTPSFCYSISNRQALALLHQIERFLRTYKKQRTALALSHYRRLTPRNGKYTRELTMERLRFEIEFLALR
jgi:LAGLIDADG-like domain